MSKKIIAAGLICLICFTGCDKKQKTTLTWSMWGLPVHLSAFKNAKLEYEKSHPDIKINLINIPWLQYNNKIVTMAAAKAAPDVLWIDRIWAAELMYKNALADLMPFIKQDEDFKLSDFTPGINDYFMANGKCCALMSHYSVLLILYNKDMFDEAGVDYPNSNWTWQDLEAAAIKISTDINNDGVMDRFGCVLPFSGNAGYATLSTFVWQNNGTIWDMSDGLGINSPQAKQAIRFLVGLIEKKAQPTPAQSLTSDIGEMFEAERLGFMYTWPSGIKEYTKDINFRWGVSVLPKGRSRATYGGGPAYAISANSKYPRQAWEFMKYLLSKPVQLKMAEVGLVMPTVRMSREELLKAFPEEEVIDTYTASLDYARGIPKLRDLNKVMWNLSLYMEDVFYGRDSIDNVCARIAAFIRSKHELPRTASPAQGNE